MARTYLGQNFLIDENWQKKIVSHFEPPELFMEIGPGKGAITKHLAYRFQQFWVCEKDRSLADIHTEGHRYQTLSMDFLDWDFKMNGQPVKHFSFIGNLPYESGTFMVQRICEHADQVDHFLFLLQKEVVQRICAKPKTRDFSSFSILVQGQFRVEALDIIPPAAFNPPPKVDSQLVRAYRRTEGMHPKDAAYHRFLKQSFLHKRKTLKNAWKSVLSPQKSDALFTRFGLNAFVRAEEIECDLWPKMFEELKRE